MKRLLLVGSLPPPPGGIAFHLHDLARAFSARGVAVEAIDPRRDGPDGRDGRIRLLGRLGRAALSGELVHVHTNGHNPKSWWVAALGSLAGPALLTLHSGLAPAFVRAHKTRVRAICARYLQVIAVSPPIAEALADAGVGAERVVVCPAFSASSVAFRLAPPGLGAIRRRHPLLLAAAVIADQPEYGADLLLDAMVRVHQIHPSAGLLLYGPRTRDPALASEVRARGLAQTVHLLGPLDRPRALAALAAADLFVRPSRADGDALSVREALALGRAVVASDAAPRPPGVRLFSAGSAEACAEAIFHTVGNPGDLGGAGLAPTAGCVPVLAGLYRRCGLEIAPETIGTRFATS